MYQLMFDANFLINQENESNNKKKKSAKIPLNMHRFNVIFKKFSGVIPPEPPLKTGLRPVDGRFAPVLLKHSNIHPTKLS